MDAVASGDLVVGDSLIVGQLSTLPNKLDHSDIDTDRLLEGLLDLEDLISGLKVKLLVSSGKGLDENLHYFNYNLN